MKKELCRKSDSENIKGQLDFSQYALNDIIKFNVNVLYSTHKHTNNNNNYAYRQAVIRNPSSPIYNEDGTYYEEYSKFQYFNPVAIQNELIGDTRSKHARLTGNVTVEPIKGWKTNLMISRKETETTSQNYYSSGYLGNKKASEDSETSTQTTVRGSASKGSYLDRSDNLEPNFEI